MCRQPIHLLLASALCLGVLAITGCDGDVDVQPIESEQVDTTPAESSDQVQPPAERSTSDELTSEPSGGNGGP